LAEAGMASGLFFEPFSAEAFGSLLNFELLSLGFGSELFLFFPFFEGCGLDTFFAPFVDASFFFVASPLLSPSSPSSFLACVEHGVSKTIAILHEEYAQ
jgi:hypothetical protein